jgi:hypothetical protein
MGEGVELIGWWGEGTGVHGSGVVTRMTSWGEEGERIAMEEEETVAQEGAEPPVEEEGVELTLLREEGEGQTAADTAVAAAASASVPACPCSSSACTSPRYPRPPSRTAASPWQLGSRVTHPSLQPSWHFAAQK